MSIVDELVREESNRNGSLYIRSLLTNSRFLRAAAGLSIEVPWADQIVSQLRDKAMNFKKVLEMTGINAFDFWRVYASYIRFHTKTPYNLKLHLLQLETTIFLEYCWIGACDSVRFIKSKAAQSLIDYKRRSRSDVSDDPAAEKENCREELFETGNDLTNLSLSEEVAGPEQKFFIKLLEIIAERIHNLCSLLKLSEKQKEFVWIIMKHVICEHIDLLRDRHLDLMIICAIYIMKKKSDSTDRAEQDRRGFEHGKTVRESYFNDIFKA